MARSIDLSPGWSLSSWMTYITHTRCIYPLITFQRLVPLISESEWSSIKMPCYCHLCSYQESGWTSMGDSKQAGLGFHTAARARGSDGRSVARAASLGSTSIHSDSTACGGRGGHEDSSPTWQPIPDQSNLRSEKTFSPTSPTSAAGV